MKGRTKQKLKARREIIMHLAANIKKRNITSTCRRLGIDRNFFRRNIEQKEDKKRKDALDEGTVQSIETFYKEENVSTTIPNKKAIGKDLKIKYVLQTSYKTSYDRWKAENPTKKVSFSTFQKHKPKNVLKQSKRHLLQCLCEYCENVRLKIDAVNSYAKSMHADDMKLADKYKLGELIMCPKIVDSDFHDIACIDRKCKNCSTKALEDKLQPLLQTEEVKWKSWDLVRYENTETGKVTSKRQLVERSACPEEFIQLFVKEVIFLIKHLFEANWQQVQFSGLIKCLNPNQVVVTVDFAENFTCFNQNEIQGVHWMRNLVTIHPSIVHYICPDDGVIVEEAVDIVSDDLTHDTHAFHHYQSLIHQYLISNRKVDIDEMVIISDGCAAQYKSRLAFMDTSMSTIDFGYSVERCYYGSRHGKNRCDGEGGILKSKVSRAIVSGEVVVNDAKSFAEYCKNTSTKNDAVNGTHIHKRRTIIFVPKSSIKHSRPEREVKTVKGTRSFHSVKGVQKGVILTRRLSCFCKNCQLKKFDECNNKKWVDSWKQHCLIPTNEGAEFVNQQQHPMDVNQQHESVDGDNQQQQLIDGGQQQHSNVMDSQLQSKDVFKQQSTDGDGEIQAVDYHKQDAVEVIELITDLGDNLPVIDFGMGDMLELDIMNKSDASEDTFSISINGIMDVLNTPDKSEIDKDKDMKSVTVSPKDQMSEGENHITEPNETLTRYSVGTHVLVKYGSETLPAVITSVEGPVSWVYYFKRKPKPKDEWTLEETNFSILEQEIV